MFSCAAASMVAFLCPQDFLFVLNIRGALKMGGQEWVEPQFHIGKPKSRQ